MPAVSTTNKLYKSIVELVSLSCKKPIAQICFANDTHLTVKASTNKLLNKKSIPLSESFCLHTLQQDDIVEINDITQDRRFKHHNFVTKSPYLKYYAGAPIKLHEKNIGTLCVFDHEPGMLTTVQKAELSNISQILSQILAALNINTKQIQPLYRANRLNMLHLDSRYLVHELSQPITAMNQYIDAMTELSQTSLPRVHKLNEQLDRFSNQLMRMNQIIFNHKDFIEGNWSEKFTKTNIKRLIQNTIVLVEMELLKKKSSSTSILIMLYPTFIANNYRFSKSL